MMFERHRPRYPGVIAALCCLALAGLTYCGPSAPPATERAESSAAGDVQRYNIRGQVVQLEPENQAATIEHEEIIGWMDAMTMRFPVKEKTDWEKLTVGAQIEAIVFVSSDGFYVGEVDLIDGEEQQEQEPEQP